MTSSNDGQYLQILNRRFAPSLCDTMHESEARFCVRASVYWCANRNLELTYGHALYQIDVCQGFDTGTLGCGLGSCQRRAELGFAEGLETRILIG